MIILDGKGLAKEMQASQQQRVHDFTVRRGRKPKLVVVIVGENPASQIYVRNKHLACDKVGMDSAIVALPSQITQVELQRQLSQLNEDKGIDGILLQLPLPKHLDEFAVTNFISSKKDADGFTVESLGRLWAGHGKIAPCTPQGVMRLLRRYQIPLRGKKAVVVGRSLIVGRPMAELLLKENATVTIAHSQTENLREVTLQGDIVVVAAGKSGFLGRDDFKKNSVIVDVGIHGSGSGKVCGDVRQQELADWASAMTPVPGGVGPMTIACLIENTLDLAENV